MLLLRRPKSEFLTPEEFDYLAIRPRDEGDLSGHQLRAHGRNPRNRAGSERTGIGGLNIGDAEAEVVYANYGSPDDFQKLEQMKIDVRSKIILVRYGQNFRGVKAFVAQEHGAAGVLIYSDPADDGWRLGDKYPQGPWRPDTGVQRCSIGYMFQFPGDPTTPGIASVPDLPDSKRTPPEQSTQLPRIPSMPISYADAWPILEHLGGQDSPRDWQGSLPFTYHVGPGPTKVKIHLKQDYQFRTIWDVVGRIRGSELPDEWVVAGNHRDAWVYGAVDPNSGTAAMLESVHGIGDPGTRRIRRSARARM